MKKISLLLITLASLSLVNAQQTPNYITRFSSDPPVVINSTIYQSTPNIGIGTASPNARLDIYYAWDVPTIPFKISDHNGFGIYVSNQNTLNFDYGVNASSVGIINYAGYNGGTTQFRDFAIYNGKNGHIATFQGSSGNMGINTTAPYFKLDAAGDIRIQGANKLYFGGTGATDNDVNLYRSAANVLKTDDDFIVTGTLTTPYIKITTSPGLNKILVSDANGNGTWQSGITGPSGATGATGTDGVQGIAG